MLSNRVHENRGDDDKTEGIIYVAKITRTVMKKVTFIQGNHTLHVNLG